MARVGPGRRLGGGILEPELAEPPILCTPTGEHLKPEFLKVNPLGKVPALRDGDFLLAER